MARLNLAGLIVDARLHRLNLKGARTVLDDSANGDDVLGALFDEQDVQVKLQAAFRHALAERTGFLLLTGDGELRVSDAQHCAVETDVDGNVVAALSIHRDDVADQDVAILARPGYFRVSTRSGRCFLPGGRGWAFSPESWETGPREPSGFEFVPAYPLETPGGSLIEAHIPALERVNHGILQRMIIVAMQAFRQRGMKNLPDRDPETGEEIDYSGLFESAPDSLWMLPEGVDVWESSQTDISPVLNAVKDDIRFLAAASKTPLFMISPDDANGSAEGASTQRETLLFDIEAIQAAFNAPLKRMLSDMLRIRGEVERADLHGIRLQWANPRRSSVGERSQAALTATQAGIPFRTVMKQFAELEPNEVEDAERQRADDVFAQAMTAAGTSRVSVDG